MPQGPFQLKFLFVKLVSVYMKLESWDPTFPPSVQSGRHHVFIRAGLGLAWLGKERRGWTLRVPTVICALVKRENKIKIVKRARKTEIKYI